VVFLALDAPHLQVFYGIEIVVFYQFQTLRVTVLEFRPSDVVVVAGFAKFDWLTTLRHFRLYSLRFLR